MGIPLTDAVRVSWVKSPINYTTSNGLQIESTDIDFAGCISTPGRVHHAFTGTGAINAGSLACIDGTVVN